MDASTIASTTTAPPPKSRKARQRLKKNRGRPSNGERDPVSHRKQADRGTDELVSRRMQMVQGGDPTLAEYPLGVCFARGLLDRDSDRAQDMHNAGLAYAKARAIVFGRVTRGSRTFDSIIDGVWHEWLAEVSEEQEASEKRQNDRYHALDDALRGAGSRARKVVENICVHERWPRFLDTSARKQPSAWQADARDLEALKAGLAALDEFVREGRNSRRSKS